MSTFERSLLRALAVKIETTAGTDAIAGTPAAGDWVDASFQIAPDVIFTPDPSFRASLDPRPPIAGGARFSIGGVRIPIRGSGVAGTPPEWFRFLRAASMLQTLTAAAVGAPTAAAAGTTTTVTLASSPYGNTLDQYRGMPITLSGNPATARTTLITDYTTGRVATLSRTFDSALSASTQTVIPINQLLTPSEIESEWSRLTVYAYQGGQVFKGVGCAVANPRLRFVAGQAAFFECDLAGKLLEAPAEAALPAGAATVTRPQVPTWRGGEAQLGRAAVFVSEATFSLGTGLMRPPSPEEDEGFGLAEVMSRSPACTLTIMSNSSATPSRIAAMRAGTETLFTAMLGNSTANRIGVMFSPAQIVGLAPTSFDGADAESLTLAGTRPGGSLTITAW